MLPILGLQYIEAIYFRLVALLSTIINTEQFSADQLYLIMVKHDAF